MFSYFYSDCMQSLITKFHKTQSLVVYQCSTRGNHHLYKRWVLLRLASCNNKQKRRVMFPVTNILDATNESNRLASHKLWLQMNLCQFQLTILQLQQGRGFHDLGGRIQEWVTHGVEASRCFYIRHNMGDPRILHRYVPLPEKQVNFTKFTCIYLDISFYLMGIISLYFRTN